MFRKLSKKISIEFQVGEQIILARRGSDKKINDVKQRRSKKNLILCLLLQVQMSFLIIRFDSDQAHDGSKH